MEPRLYLWTCGFSADRNDQRPHHANYSQPVVWSMNGGDIMRDCNRSCAAAAATRVIT